MEKVIKRHEKWPIMLTEFLEDQKNLAFEWGVRDCMIFAADAVWYLTGYDPAWNLRDTYGTEGEADALIAEAGGMKELCTKQLGIDPHDNHKTAQRGDVILMEVSGSHVFGVVDDSGQKAACLDPVKGIVRVPIKSCVAVWSY